MNSIRNNSQKLDLYVKCHESRGGGQRWEYAVMFWLLEKCIACGGDNLIPSEQ